MVMTKLDTKLSEIIERNTLRNYSIHDNFYPKSTLQAFIYESQPQIFNNSKKKKLGHEIERITERATVRMEFT